VKQSAQITDGFVEVKFKPLAGREDQAGGLVWRFKDANNYYIARANHAGRRVTIKYVDAPVAKQWHTLRVEFAGKAIKVTLDGTQYIIAENDQIAQC
jgi:hypothetical protein